MGIFTGIIVVASGFAIRTEWIGKTFNWMKSFVVSGIIALIFIVFFQLFGYTVSWERGGGEMILTIPATLALVGILGRMRYRARSV